MGLKSDKLCVECETPLIGRVDKKFCNDMCRNSYNNLLNKDANEYVRKVNVILRKNRRILSSLMNGSEKGKATKEKYQIRIFINPFQNLTRPISSTFSESSGRKLSHGPILDIFFFEQISRNERFIKTIDLYCNLIPQLMGFSVNL